MSLQARAAMRGGGSASHSYSLLLDALDQPGLPDRQIAELGVAAGYSSQAVVPVRTGLEHHRVALAAARRAGDSSLANDAFLAAAVSEMMCGERVDATRLSEVAHASWDTPHRFAEAWTIDGLIKYAVGDFAGAVESMTRVRGELHDRGLGAASSSLVYYLPVCLLAVGRTQEALAFAEREVARAELAESQLWLGLARCGRAAVAVRAGERALALEDLELVRQMVAAGADHPPLRAYTQETSGELLLVDGDPKGARRELGALARWTRDVFGFHHSGANRFWPDLAEAHVACGDLVHAEEVVSCLLVSGRRRDEAWSVGVGERGRALLLAQAGDVAAAERTADRRACCQRADHQADGGGGVRESEDGGGQSDPHLPQARHPLARRARHANGTTTRVGRESEVVAGRLAPRHAEHRCPQVRADSERYPQIFSGVNDSRRDRECLGTSRSDGGVRGGRLVKGRNPHDHQRGHRQL